MSIKQAAQQVLRPIVERWVMWLRGDIELVIYRCGWARPHFSIGRLMPIVPNCLRIFWHGGWHVEFKVFRAT